MEQKVGLVGLGIMGGAFARNLLLGGLKVFGCDPSLEAKEKFASLGGEVIETPAQLAARVPIILLSLPTVSALAEVTEGQRGIAASGQSGLIVIEASTFPLDAKLRARDLLAARGQILLDCPVSGTGAQAAVADLVIFASGDPAAIGRCREIFDRIGRRHINLGEFGAGMKLKIIANHLVTIHNVAAGEAMAFAAKAGSASRQSMNR